MIKCTNVTEDMIAYSIPDDPCHCAVHYALVPILGQYCQVHATHVDADGSGTKAARYELSPDLRNWICAFDDGYQMQPIMICVDTDHKYIGVIGEVSAAEIAEHKDALCRMAAHRSFSFTTGE